MLSAHDIHGVVKFILHKVNVFLNLQAVKQLNIHDNPVNSTIWYSMNNNSDSEFIDTIDQSEHQNLFTL